MTQDEHLKILAFIDRAVGGVQPPIDVEADAIIRACFKRNPDAAYRVTMLAMTQVPPAPVPKAARQRRWLPALFERREAIAS